MTAEETVEKSKVCFACFGLPEFVVTNNGTQFTSAVFTDFLSKNGIRFMTSPVCHPASNGQAENLVKSFKNNLLECVRDNFNRCASFNTLINRFLFSYRNANHRSTDVTSSSRVFQYKTKTRLDLLNEKVKEGRNIALHKALPAVPMVPLSEISNKLDSRGHNEFTVAKPAEFSPELSGNVNDGGAEVT
ncbi:hypothetical protein ILUMI_14264 [Ignelater luminosus]|uniref:Integrase catalytic domain-containing protein n=1 Tax=Ignelater luminosus TaxID=2038154 RepID=A0A8K0CQU1_IGNLU|nr:hypothetical protein ILUMI_14264 [Ignelater luminosus]